MRTIRLGELSLEQLLLVADQEDIPVHSRISRCIVQADLISVEGIKLKIEDLQECLPLKGDKLGRLLAVEVGIDFSLFDIFYEKCMSIPETKFFFNIREWLREQGISQHYLENSALLSATSAILYERKILLEQSNFQVGDIVPKFLWYWYGNQLGINTKIFLMSLKNFQEAVSHYTDQTPEEYLESCEFSRLDKDLLPFLLYQTTEHLLTLANSLPNPGLFFQTRAGALDYLVIRYQMNKKLEDTYLGFFSEINEEYYPGRLQMVEAIYARDGFKKIPSFYSEPTQIELLALPPVWFEQIYCQILLESPHIVNFQIRLREVFPILQDLELNPFDEEFCKEFRTAVNCNLQLQPKNRTELVELLKSKNFEKIHPKIIKEICGWDFSYVRHIIQAIQNNMEEAEFQVVTNLDLGPELDYLLEPHEDFMITFGTFTDYKCYSPEDLIASFVVTDRFVAFRKPDSPNEVFTNDQMDQLLTYLSEYPPDTISEYGNRVQPLIDKIENGLSEERAIDVSGFAEQLLDLSEKDRVQAEKIFRNFFQAGMFQRTWTGTGKYPMSYRDTLGSTLGEIEIRMTPVLNNIREAYDSVSILGQAILESLPVVDMVDSLFIRRADPLLSFENQTREGNFCIGYGGRLMIYSGYFYLSALGLDIPDFSLQKFEPESTHR